MNVFVGCERELKKLLQEGQWRSQDFRERAAQKNQGGTRKETKDGNKEGNKVRTHRLTQLVLFNCKTENTTNVKLNNMYI
jgi:hypothetical protein